MAHAKKTKVEITKRVDGVQLTLTSGEVDFLLAVLAKVGGSGANSPRKYADTIKAALEKTVGHGYKETDAYPLSSGNISFSDYGTAVKPSLSWNQLTPYSNSRTFGTTTPNRYA